MTSYMIGSTAQEIYPGNQGELTLYNGGALTIYLGTDPSITPTTGYPLTPGSSMTWKTRSPIWAVLQTFQETAGQRFEFARRGTPTANLIVNPAGSDITSQGFNRVLVGSDTKVANLGSWVYTPFLETSSFRSMSFTGLFKSPAFAGASTSYGDNIWVSTAYFDVDDTGNAILLGGDDFSVFIANDVGLDSKTNVYTITAPVDSGRGRYVQFAFHNANIGLTSVTLDYKIYGSFQTSDFRWTSSGSAFGSPAISPALLSSFVSANSFGTYATVPLNYFTPSTNRVPLHRLGRYIDMSINVTIASASSVFALNGSVTTAQYANVSTTAVGVVTNRNIPVPLEGLTILTNGTTTASGFVALTFHD